MLTGLRNLLCSSLALSLVVAPALRAQQTNTAPIPSQIALAHTIFLTNLGADSNFPGSADDSYNALYASLKSWGRYQLVGSADQADLVFQLRSRAPITSVNGVDGDVNSYSSPVFQLTIVDPRTSLTLWTINSPVNLSGKEKDRSKWFALAVADLTSRIKVMDGQALTAAETAQLTEVPPSHGKRNGLILVGVFGGLAVGGGLLLYHEYNANKPQTPYDLTCAGNSFFCTH